MSCAGRSPTAFGRAPFSKGGQRDAREACDAILACQRDAREACDVILACQRDAREARDAIPACQRDAREARDAILACYESAADREGRPYGEEPGFSLWGEAPPLFVSLFAA